MPSEKPDVELGDGVEIRWSHQHGEIVGGLLSHPLPANPTGVCWGSFTLRGKGQDGHPEWDFNGDYETPTLTPSFLCHCGFHGFVTNGKWVPA